MPAPLLYYYVLHGLELPGTLTERKDGYTEAPNSQAGAAALPTTLVQAPAMPAALVYYHVLNGLALPASCESTASLTGAHLPANEAWEQTYTFDNPLYWEYFHVDQGRAEAFDWYANPEMVVEAVERAVAALGRARETVRIIDLGMGTSDVLLDLAGRGYTGLVGVDFSPVSVEFMQAAAAERGLGPGVLSLHQADVTQLERFADGSFDILLDKGTLDCFVNGSAHALIPVYLREIRRLMRDAGSRLLLVASNAADIPFLMQTGVVRRDTFVDPEDAVPSSLPVSRVYNEPVRASRTPLLCVLERVVHDTRHLFCIGRADRLDTDVHRHAVPIVCDYCGARYCEEDLPQRCSACANRLYRMFV